MSVKYTNHTKKRRDEILNKSSRFLRVFAEEVANVSQAGTPKKTGDLRRSVIKQVYGLTGMIFWNKRYAARMEKTQFKSYTTPGTGPYFAKNAVKKTLNKQSNLYKKA